MLNSNFFSKLLLVLVMFSLVLHPQVEVFAIHLSSQTEATPIEINELLAQDGLHFSYNDIVGLLAGIENGELEKRNNPEELDRLSHLLVFLARKGMLPDELNDESDLEGDIQELLSSESNPYKYAYDFYLEGKYQFAPAICYSSADLILCKSWFKKTAKQIGKFVKKHKKEIIIGAVVVIAAVAVVVVVSAVVSAGAAASVAADAATAGAAATAAGAAASSGSGHKEDNNSGSREQILDTSFNENVCLFKESLIEEQFLQSNNSGLSMEENGRILGQIFAHQSLNSLVPHEYSFPFSYEGSPESKVFGDLITDQHEMIDRAFSLDKIQPNFTMDLGADFKELVYQLRGECAFELKHYDQAIFDFGKTIEINPHNHIAYLDRAVVYLEVGDYENSLSDYQQYTEQKSPLQQGTFMFAAAFTKALPRGIRDSGCQLGSFVSDAVCHPFDTAVEVTRAFVTLNKLVYSQEWAVIGETLAPEVYELVIKWDLAGYAFGKYGSDILIPGASVKILSRGVKGAKELAIACNALKTAKKTLLLESVVGLESGAKIGEVVRVSQTAIALGEELGYSAHEMTQLKQAGKLEEVIINTKELMGKLKPYQGQYMEEMQIRGLLHECGIQTFPRPKGVPENFRIKLSDKGAGMKYVHPKDEGTYVRVMPAISGSQLPAQQKPYVNYRIKGQSVDKNGNFVSNKSVEAHIPIDEFTYVGD